MSETATPVLYEVAPLLKLNKADLANRVIREKTDRDARITAIVRDRDDRIKSFADALQNERNAHRQTIEQLAGAQAKIRQTDHELAHAKAQIEEARRLLDKQDGSLVAFELVISMLTGKPRPGAVGSPEAIAKADAAQKSPNPLAEMLRAIGFPG